jgi:hypothetical protein
MHKPIGSMQQPWSFCNQAGDACICNEGYVTYGSTDTQCNYEQKGKTAPLILAIIPATTGLGIQWFLIDDTEMGLLQLFTGGTVGWICIAILACLLGGFAACCGSSEGAEDRTGASMLCIYCLVALYAISNVAWWIYSIVYFASSPEDGNGVPLN